MDEMLLFKAAFVILAIACFVFGGLMMKQSLMALLRPADERRDPGPMMWHVHVATLTLGLVVFLFGFALIALLRHI